MGGDHRLRNNRVSDTHRETLLSTPENGWATPKKRPGSNPRAPESSSSNCLRPKRLAPIVVSTENGSNSNPGGDDVPPGMAHMLLIDFGWGERGLDRQCEGPAHAQRSPCSCVAPIARLRKTPERAPPRCRRNPGSLPARGGEGLQSRPETACHVPPRRPAPVDVGRRRCRRLVRLRIAHSRQVPTDTPRS